MRTVLQVPMTMDLRTAATAAANDLGFSSLQEAVRILLKKLAKRQVTVRIEEETIQLSPKAKKKYDKMLDDLERGKVKTKTFSDNDSLMRYLSQ